jgi:putative oxidoreductase
MNALFSLHNALFDRLGRRSDVVLPTLARGVFGAVLLLYFWNSAMTKVGSGMLGIFRPTDGAYVQIFPKAMEAVTYDSSQLSTLHWLIAVTGTWAEFLLPALILIGLFTRLAALGMIGFVIVQSLTDVFGHSMVDDKTLGMWFDRIPYSIIMDQRVLWITLLLILVFKGAGPLSIDRLMRRLT